VYADLDPPGLGALAAYVQAVAQTLKRQEAGAVAAGRIDWPVPGRQG
jgi:hypothetical protein